MPVKSRRHGDVVALSASLASFKPNTGLSREALDQSAELMCSVLADTQRILQKTLGVHWSVAGPAFAGLHQLTEDQYKELFAAVDVIAERVRSLGRPAPAMPRQLAAQADLSEDTVQTMRVDEMVRALAADHEAICRLMRETVEGCEERKDFVTADLLIARMSAHEKAVWMLRATLAE